MAILQMPGKMVLPTDRNTRDYKEIADISDFWDMVQNYSLETSGLRI
jgi:hypothetical protein